MVKLYRCFESFCVGEFDEYNCCFKEKGVDEGEVFICDPDVEGDYVWIDSDKKNLRITKEQLKGYFEELREE